MAEYKCAICGLHYRSRKLAEKCYRWCSASKSCNLDITRQSIERSSGDANGE